MPVKFYLDNRHNKKDEVPIRVSISIRNSRLVSTVGYAIYPNSWDSENQRVYPKFKSVNRLNATPKIINDRLKAIQLHFDKKALLATSKPSLEELKKDLSEITGSTRHRYNISEEKTVLERFDDFVKEGSSIHQWSPGTLECWNAFRGHISQLGTNIKFSYFNEQGIQRFINHLRNDSQMREVTIKKHFSNLKWFLGWAIRKGYCQETAIEKYSARFLEIQQPIIFLTPEELKRLYKFQIPSDGETVTLKRYDGEEYEKTVSNSSSLGKTRDLFCFCAFTGLRYSDMAKLKRSDIEKKALLSTTKKTHERLIIELNSFSRAILDKYKDEKYPDDLALPVISNQKMNIYLKDLCELCGFTDTVTKVFIAGGSRKEEKYMKWELIGTHAARRTFICFAISMGIPPEIVMKWTGHSSYNAMKPYIEIAEKVKENAMNTLEQELINTIYGDEQDEENTERS
jgi:integrase